MELDLQGKVALVTGASRGIGRSIALKLADEGVTVAVNYNNSKAEADEVVNQIRQKGQNAKAYQCSVDDRVSVPLMVQQIKNDFGKIDILVNNAGIAHSATMYGTTYEQWDETISVNLTGAFNVTKAVLSNMYRQQSGVIIFIASTAATNSDIGQAAYAASKAGLLALSRTLALETARKGIRVFTISPGWVDTDMTLQSLSEDKIEKLMQRNPMGRFAHVDEISNLVAYLASSNTSYAVRSNFIVDGGES